MYLLITRERSRAKSHSCTEYPHSDTDTYTRTHTHTLYAKQVFAMVCALLATSMNDFMMIVVNIVEIVLGDLRQLEEILPINLFDYCDDRKHWESIAKWT